MSLPHSSLSSSSSSSSSSKKYVIVMGRRGVGKSSFIAQHCESARQPKISDSNKRVTTAQAEFPCATDPNIIFVDTVGTDARGFDGGHASMQIDTLVSYIVLLSSPRWAEEFEEICDLKKWDPRHHPEYVHAFAAPNSVLKEGAPPDLKPLVEFKLDQLHYCRSISSNSTILTQSLQKQKRTAATSSIALSNAPPSEVQLLFGDQRLTEEHERIHLWMKPTNLVCRQLSMPTTAWQSINKIENVRALRRLGEVRLKHLLLSMTNNDAKRVEELLNNDSLHNVVRQSNGLKLHIETVFHADKLSVEKYSDYLEALFEHFCTDRKYHKYVVFLINAITSGRLCQD